MMKFISIYGWVNSIFPFRKLKKIEKKRDKSKENNKSKIPNDEQLDSDGELTDKKVLYNQLHDVSGKHMQIEISKKEKFF